MSLYEYAPAEIPGSEDLDAIRQVCLDYLDSWYEGDAEKMGRVLHPRLAKHSLARLTDRSGAVEFVLKPHTAQSMIEITAQGIGNEPPDVRRMDVRILSAKHHIASAEVVCHDMTDLVHLVRLPDGWKIVHALWTIENGQIFDLAKDE